jgi:predicted CoA-binding protein
MNVAVLGASQKHERYSNMAVRMLAESGHTVFPVHPVLSDIDGLPVFKRLADIPAPIHTVTVYLAPERSASLAPDILASLPRRVIFNPGAESEELARLLEAVGIATLHACTLVLLRTGQFDAADMEASRS